LGIGDEVEVIDESVAFYHKIGRLMDITPDGELIVELHRARQIEVDAHQVDVRDRSLLNIAVSIWETYEGRLE
jgi:hypothetical protein